MTLHVTMTGAAIAGAKSGLTLTSQARSVQRFSRKRPAQSAALIAVFVANAALLETPSNTDAPVFPEPSHPAFGALDSPDDAFGSTLSMHRTTTTRRLGWPASLSAMATREKLLGRSGAPLGPYRMIGTQSR